MTDNSKNQVWRLVAFPTESGFLKKIAIVAVLAVLLAWTCYYFTRDEPETNSYTFVTTPLERGDLKVEINSTGTVKPVVEVLVGSQVSGYIKNLYADFESQVTKGQLIALIDPDTFKAKVEQAKADLLAARASLAKAEVTLIDEIRTLRRKEGLIGRDSISQSDFDAQKTKTEAAEAQVEVEKARIAQAEAKLHEADLQLKYAHIEAPVTGTVTSRSMDVGQTVTAGFQTPVLFKIAEDLTRMQVYTNVDEADIGKIKVGQSATFTVPAFPEKFFVASVTQIRNEPKIEQNVVTYNVILDVTNDELLLRPGMTTNVQILVSEIKDTLMLPDAALMFSPPDNAFLKGKPKISLPQEGRRTVWRLEGKNDLKPYSVKVGIAGPQKTQIFTDELNVGAPIAVEAVSKKKKLTSPGGMIRF